MPVKLVYEGCACRNRAIQQEKQVVADDEELVSNASRHDETSLMRTCCQRERNDARTHAANGASVGGRFAATSGAPAPHRSQ